MKPLYLFFHLAKTGGTTFVGHMYEQWKFDEDFVDLGPAGDNFRKENNRQPLASRSSEELDKIKAVTGHLVYWETRDLFPLRDIRMILFLRRPLQRIISHYTFDSSVTGETFAEWYNHWIKNQTIAFLFDHLRVNSLEDVLEKLEQFWYIGFTEELDTALNYIYPQMGLTPEYKNRRVAGEPENSTRELGFDPDRKIKKTYQATPDEIKMIEEDNKLATWFYEHVRNNTKNGKYTKPQNIVFPTTDKTTGEQLSVIFGSTLLPLISILSQSW